MPECDRALFKKWALSPWGLVCHESWINETTTVTPSNHTLCHPAETRQENKRKRKNGRKRKERKKRGNGVGRQAETENWRGDEGSGGEEEK